MALESVVDGRVEGSYDQDLRRQKGRVEPVSETRTPTAAREGEAREADGMAY